MMPDNNSAPIKSSIDINAITSAAPKVIYANTDQEVIIVTRDKLHLCLHGAVDRMGRRDRWMVPLGVLVPLVLAVATTSFTRRFGVGGAEWETVFIMLIFFTLLWLVYTLRQRGNSVTLASIVEELAKNPVSLARSVAGEARDMDDVVAVVGYLDHVSPAEDDFFEDVSESSQTGHAPILSLKPGDRVSHEKFGWGIVKSTTGGRENLEAKIDFGRTFGIKHLVIRYAPLVKL